MKKRPWNNSCYHNFSLTEGHFFDMTKADWFILHLTHRGLSHLKMALKGGESLRRLPFAFHRVNGPFFLTLLTKKEVVSYEPEQEGGSSGNFRIHQGLG